MSYLTHSPLTHSPDKLLSKRLKVVTAEDIDETPSEEEFPEDSEIIPDSQDIASTAVNSEPIRSGSISDLVSADSAKIMGDKSMRQSAYSLKSDSQILYEPGEQGNEESVPKEIKTLLHSLPFFSGLDSEEFIDNISKTLRVRKCKPGDVIVRQGEVAKAMFFIIKGTLKVISEDGEIDLAELSSGSYFGEIGILFDVKRTATVVAKTSVTLATLTSERVQKELAAYPQINKSIQEQAQIRLLSLAKEYEKYGRKVSSVLAAHIAELGETHANTNIKVVIEEFQQEVGNETDIPIMVDQTRSHSTKDIETGPLSPLLSDEDDDDDYDDSLPVIAMNMSEFTEIAVPTDVSIKVASPTALPAPKSSAAILSQKMAEKRRASVAVWSDQKLLQFAQNVITQTTIKESRFAKPLSKISLHSAASKESLFLDENDKKGIFVLAIPELVRCLKFLDLTVLTRMRKVNKYFFKIIMESDLNFYNYVDLAFYSKKITNEKLGLLSKIMGPQVEVLSLRNCWSITDLGLIQMASLCEKLISLDLSSVWELTDAGLFQIAEASEQLAYIDLSNCKKITDKGILSLVQKAVNLQTINVAYCKNLTGAMMNHCTWSTIKNVNFQRCTGIRDNGFLLWNLPGPDPSLSLNALTFAIEEINLNDCSFLSDSTIEIISKKCPNLKRISLSFCCSLTEKFASFLTQGCPFIERLDMSYCGGAVTDNSLQILAQGLPKLTTLGIRGCVQVTDTGMAHLATHAILLVNINFTQCKNVSPTIESKLGIKWNCLTSPIFPQEPVAIEYLRERKGTI